MNSTKKIRHHFHHPFSVVSALIGASSILTMIVAAPAFAANDRFIVASPVDLKQVAAVTKFRGCFGRDFSGYNTQLRREKNRVMKHYLEPIDALAGTTNKFRVYAPFKGKIVRIEKEKDGRGSQIWLSLSGKSTDWSVVYSHINPLRGLRVGTRLRAGQRIGTAHLKGGDLDIALTRRTRGRTVYDSYLTHLSPALASDYAAAGLTEQRLITSRSSRNAQPCDFSRRQYSDWVLLNGQMTFKRVGNLPWEFNGTAWKPKYRPPVCPSVIPLRSPVDLSLPTSVLNPGQVRGGQYKPHGGFRLDTSAYDAVTLVAPMDAYVVDGSRHYENGEIQYYFDFVAPCGIRYRLDHLNKLSPAMQKLADQLPAPSNGSQSSLVTPRLVRAGTVIATAVGHPDNVGFDLGVYDLRRRNAAAENVTYRNAHADMKGNAYYAVCWFDWLAADDQATIRALPPADQVSGSSSDYCAS